MRIDQARSRFMPASVDATNVDFSDRVNGKRKSYKASSRRHRILEDGTEELGDLSDEDDSGNLARKIARLKREIEEAKEEYGKQKAAEDKPEGEVTEQGEEIESLSKTLEELSRLDESRTTKTTISAPTAPISTASPADQPAGEVGAGASYTITYAPTYEQTHALAKAADFDARLVFLEKALGVGSAAMPEFDSKGLPRAVIPMVENLHRQVSTLSEATTPNLDAISRRVRTLTQEAQNLEKARKNARQAQEALIQAGASPAPAEGAVQEDSEQIAKINALYGLIPTIENLSPLLPPLLDRLRSLRMIHADAATASETLQRLEQKQSEMATDIQQWRGGLEKLEGAVRDGDASRAKNMEVIEGWVKDLEGRISKLS